MNVGLVSNTYSSITNGKGALSSAKQTADGNSFAALVEKLRGGEEKSEASVSSSQVTARGRLNGDWTSGFAGSFTQTAAKPTGAAVNQANIHVQPKTIDKTSELYEKSLELENYFVKQMLGAMRKTVHKTNEGDFAQNMYEDMLYDEYSTAMTKSAGFGLADQIYLSLV
ncbi:rod-binding protein [Treponema sp. C6A8]|uniref:rod-binding protein n=1 Tax=Treponema sp. C6A8 TaxID=1410609 RepID=UPI0004896A05|nr:rod-binding protein [Treponema sp. C6A8]